MEDLLRRFTMGAILGALALWSGCAAVDNLVRPLHSYTVGTVLAGLFFGWLAVLVGLFAVGAAFWRKK